MVRKAGVAKSKFSDRCAGDDQDILKCFGDRNVYIDGHGPFCLIIDREVDKNDYEGVGVFETMSQACWPKSSCLPIRKGSLINNCGTMYKVADKPVDQHDGWMCARLNKSCEHC